MSERTRKIRTYEQALKHACTFQEWQEIAEELDLSKRTVETQISNALKRLRKDIFAYLKALIIMALQIFS